MWHDNPFDLWDDEEFTPRWICFGKGGGSPGPQTSTTNTSSLPDYVEPFFTRLLQRTERETNQDYVPYEGQRLADFGQDTQASFSGIRGINAAGDTPDILNASDAMTRASGIGAGRNDFMTSGALDVGAGGQRNIDAYMNPYIDQVLNRGQARAQQRFDEDQVQRQADFARRGAFSSSRRDIASETARSDLNEQLLDIEARGLANAYDSAGQLFTSDEQRRLQSQIENERARQAAGQLELQAGQGLAGLGTQRQQLGLQRADAMGRIGALQEAQRQAELDIDYQDFTNQRDFERQNLNFYSGILHGVPVEPNAEVTRYEAPGNNIAQMLGLGLGGASLYQQLAAAGQAGVAS